MFIKEQVNTVKTLTLPVNITKSKLMQQRPKYLNFQSLLWVMIQKLWILHFS